LEDKFNFIDLILLFDYLIIEERQFAVFLDIFDFII